MPLFKGKASKAKPKKQIDYITRPDKAVIISNQSMDDSRDYTVQFAETCAMYGKGGSHNERKYYSFKLSCDPCDKVTPEKSHELAERLAQALFPGHECIIATHNDTDTIHSHIIINAVSFETGKKLHLNDGAYRDSKDLADVLACDMGLTPLNWRDKTKARREREAEGCPVSSDNKHLTLSEEYIGRRENLSTASWKEALRQAINEAKHHCTDRAEFQRYLQDVFGVTMPRNTAKTVTFVHPAVGETKAVRGAKLGADYTAAAIDQALQANKERSSINAGLFITEEQQPTTSTESTHTAANPAIPIIISQPAGQTGNRKRSAPGSVGDVGAELRSLDEAVQSIVGGNKSSRERVVKRVDKRTEEQPSPVKTVAEHERSVQQKPKRRSNSYAR